MFHRTRALTVVLVSASCFFASPGSSTASRIDLPCEIGPMLTSPGTVAARRNGPERTVKPAPVLTDEQLAKLPESERWLNLIRTTTLYDQVGVFAINRADGFSHNDRVFGGISFTFHEFDEFDGMDIPTIRTDVMTLEAGVHLRRTARRATRLGIRLPYVDYRDSDSTDPATASGWFDAEIFADIGFSWDDEPDHDNNRLVGLLLETRLTLPTGDEDEALGRKDATLGARPRWFFRWTPEVDKEAPRLEGSGARLTQVHVSAGLGYVHDFGVSDNSFWSPVVGVRLAWADRVFLAAELQAELHDSRLDQYDLWTEVSFALLPNRLRGQIFLSVGGVFALNDEGLRDSFAPTVGLSFGGPRAKADKSFR